jgi:hypothetical protein
VRCGPLVLPKLAAMGNTCESTGKAPSIPNSRDNSGLALIRIRTLNELKQLVARGESDALKFKKSTGQLQRAGDSLSVARMPSHS